MFGYLEIKMFGCGTRDGSTKHNAASMEGFKASNVAIGSSKDQ